MKQVTAYEGDARPIGRAEEELVEDVDAERRRLQRLQLIGLRLLVVVAIVAIWQIASGTSVGPFWVSRPSDVVARLWRWTETGTIFGHLQVTFLDMIFGFISGSLSFILLGMIYGLNRFYVKYLYS